MVFVTLPKERSEFPGSGFKFLPKTVNILFSRRAQLIINALFHGTPTVLVYCCYIMDVKIYRWDAAGSFR